MSLLLRDKLIMRQRGRSAVVFGFVFRDCGIEKMHD